jgi:hypothetical protein
VLASGAARSAEYFLDFIRPPRMHALTFLPGGPQDKSGDATRRRWLRQFCGELPDGAINGAVFFQTRAVLGSGVQRPRAAGEECDGKDECYFFHSLTEGAVFRRRSISTYMPWRKGLVDQAAARMGEV